MTEEEYAAIVPVGSDPYGQGFFKFCEMDHGWSNGLFGDILYWMFRPKSVVEFGSGTGGTLVALHRKGVEVLGLDASPASIPFVARHSSEVAAKILVHDLGLPWVAPHQFDLAVSIETLEHIAPEGADNAVATICASADIAVVTACPRTAGQNLLHLNEQPFSYWVEKFATHGLVLDLPATEVLQTVMRAFHDREVQGGCPVVPCWYFSGHIGVFKRKTQ